MRSMDGIAWAGSAMVAARTRLEIATANLANVSTDGFARVVAQGRLTAEGVNVARRIDPAGRGPLQRTGRDLDLSIVGPGSFEVEASGGARTGTRAGSFTRERDGTLSDASGRKLMAGVRAIRVPEAVRFDERGCALDAAGAVIGRIPLPAGSTLRSGFLESASVDAIHEMVDVMSAERSFESAQKVVSSIDKTREKSATDVARVK